MDNFLVSFCSGKARMLNSKVVKVIPLDRGHHVQLKLDIKEPSTVTYELTQRRSVTTRH
ncbi:unnamed protein product [Rhodiola kirilowii]